VHKKGIEDIEMGERGVTVAEHEKMSSNVMSATALAIPSTGRPLPIPPWCVCVIVCVCVCVRA
jgi:hypothetical protein